MIGEYYVVSQSSGDQYLYVIPTVYSKISEDSPYNPANGQIVQMYGQFETSPVTEDSGEAPNYESWSCNLKYFTDITDVTKEQILENIYYSGGKLMSSQRGTFSSSNNLE